MAFPTAVNSQITDAEESSCGPTTPAEAAGAIYDAVAENAAIAMQNATEAQQQMYQVAQAATAQAVSMLLGVNAEGTAAATGSIDPSRYEAIASHVAAARAAAAQGASGEQEASAVRPTGEMAAMEAFAHSLDDLNAVFARQALRVIGAAASAAILARALRVDSAAPDAQQQMAVWTGLLETVQRDLCGGDHSGG